MDTTNSRLTGTGTLRDKNTGQALAAVTYAIVGIHPDPGGVMRATAVTIDDMPSSLGAEAHRTRQVLVLEIEGGLYIDVVVVDISSEGAFTLDVAGPLLSYL